MNERETVVLRGTAFWAKVLGEPQPGYQGKGKFWSIDVIPDSVNEAAGKLGKDKIKNKDDERGKFIALRQEYRSYTTKGGEVRWTEAPKVVDINGRAWPQSKKLGNGTKVDVKMEVVNYGDKVGVYLKSIRVLKHEPYETVDFAPIGTDDEFFEAAAGAEEVANEVPIAELETNDLEDDLPF